MSQKCKTVAIDEVVNFFDLEIDGSGKFDGYPRNPHVIEILHMFQKWELCNISKNELLHLEVSTEPHSLLKDINFDKLKEFEKQIVCERLKILNSGGILRALIIRELSNGDLQNASFYIEDGFKTAFAYKLYFELNKHTEIKAYVGKK